jgi:hypothetical protein
MIEVRLHVAKAQIPASNPIVDDPRDGVEAGRVTALYPRLKPAQNEEVAMHQFVQEAGEEKPAVVFGVLEDGF